RSRGATDETAAAHTPPPSTPSPRANVRPWPSVPPSGPREEAEKAGIRMTAARQAAERVAAGFYARQRFASAQSKERDGVAALGKSDYAAAAGLFAAAQSEYQAATGEVPREEEKDRQLPQLSASLHQAP